MTPRPAPNLRLAAALAAAAALLAGCGQEASASRDGFPLAEVHRSNQPPPSKPLLSDPIVTAEQVLPHAKADVHEPLPPAVPLPSAQAVADAPANAPGAGEGGVNPAAGQAAAITDGQGSKHELGAPK